MRQYLADGLIDFTRMGDVPYLRSLMDREEIWARHPARNFYQNIRRAADVFQADAQLNNGRRNNPAPPVAPRARPGGAGDEGGGDDDDDDDGRE